MPFSASGLLLAELGGVEHDDLVEDTSGGTAERQGESSGDASLRSRSALRQAVEQYVDPAVAFPQLQMGTRGGKASAEEVLALVADARHRVSTKAGRRT